MIAARFTRTARLLVVALALVAGATAGATPAPVSAAEDCDGIWVVVDAQRLGGDVRTLCAPGSPSSGLEALKLAGVAYEFVPRIPGQVCTLDGLPDPCNGAPTDAYWSYWHAEAGGSWTYSQRGAGNRTPPANSVEGWAFGAGEQPARKPPAAAAPAPSPEPEPDATATPEATPQPTSDPSAARSPEPAALSPEPSSEDTATTGTAPPLTAGGGTAATAHDADATDVETDGLDADDRTGGADDGPGTAADTYGDDEGPGTAAEPAGVAEPTPAEDDSVALDEVSAADEASGTPVGAIAGGLLVAGLAGTAVMRSRRRDDPAGPT